MKVSRDHFEFALVFIVFIVPIVGLMLSIVYTPWFLILCLFVFLIFVPGIWSS